ncbi:uncharacterized protein LOC142347918 [Convolutriloba macropyga]|uniref:uncharacterized protein LOC142347918 n=1 Tax=Convolutriloba macropyga TaxID=536237 RepID=UPI003F51C382
MLKAPTGSMKAKRIKISVNEASVNKLFTISVNIVIYIRPCFVSFETLLFILIDACLHVTKTMLCLSILLALCLVGGKETNAAGGRNGNGGTSASSGSSSRSGGGVRRESLDFILPDPDDELGNKCLQYSRYFCLLRYWVPEKQSNRALEDSDRTTLNCLQYEEFTILQEFI